MHLSWWMFILLLMAAPYGISLTGELLIQRLFAVLAFLLFVVGVGGLFPGKKSAKYFLAFAGFLYSLGSVLEAGHFLVKGGTFGPEFWQVANTALLGMAFHMAPLQLCAGLAVAFWVTSAFISANWVFTPQRKLAFALCILGAGINVPYSSIASLIQSRWQYASLVQHSENFQSKTELKAKAGKNVVRIVLESIGDVYTDSQRFPGLAPNLSRYKYRGVSAQNMLQTKHHANSFLGHFLSSCGRSFYAVSDSGINGTCLGDVFKSAGYTNVFMRGADKNSAGPFGELYSAARGYDLFVDLEYLEKKFPKGRVQGLGFSDETIFAEALEQYRRLLSTGKPFTLTLFTLDTHGFSQGSSPSCQKNLQYTGPFHDDPLVQAVHCTDHLVAAFVERLYQLEGKDNLVIAIHSDHVQHTPSLATHEAKQTLYAAFFGTGISSYREERPTSLMDIPLTLLELSGVVSNVKFLSGISFSSQREWPLPTFSESPALLDEIALEKIDVLPPQVSPGSLEEAVEVYRDENAAIFYRQLLGPISNSHHYFVRTSKSLHSPRILAFPYKEEMATDAHFVRGLLLRQISPMNYSLSIETSAQSHWRGLVFEKIAKRVAVVVPFDLKQRAYRKRERFLTSETSAQPRIHLLSPSTFAFVGLKRVKDGLGFESQGEDPNIYIPIPTLDSQRHHIVKVGLTTTKPGLSRLFYRRPATHFSDPFSAAAWANAGTNVLEYLIPRGQLDRVLRFDPNESRGPGRYILESVQISALEEN